MGGCVVIGVVVCTDSNVRGIAGLQKIIEGVAGVVVGCRVLRKKHYCQLMSFGNLNVHINIHILSCKPRITPENLMKQGFQG